MKQPYKQAFGNASPSQNQYQLSHTWQLTDYITAIAWSGNGRYGSAISAAGEVFLFDLKTDRSTYLQTAAQASLDCLAFSSDSQFLAAAGQQGQVLIWQFPPDASSASPVLLKTIDCPGAWIDRLIWHPTQPLLSFSLGKYVQIWNVPQLNLEVTLPFEVSTVLDMTWDPPGERLAIAGYQGAKIWSMRDWDTDPTCLEMTTASIAIAWSPDGKYLACGNLDRTVTVIEADKPEQPWVMRGFPGKVRKLVWSDWISTATGAPVLASVSADGIVLWQRHAEDTIGWEGEVAGLHTATVLDVAFQPNSWTWASASEDGQVQIYHPPHPFTQTLTGAPQGFTCLAWHPSANCLAAGGHQGEIRIWSC
jgi:WD40 repeat protein